MEIVTRPMTLNYHLNETPWPELLDKAIPMGCLSHRFQGVNLTNYHTIEFRVFRGTLSSTLF